MRLFPFSFLKYIPLRIVLLSLFLFGFLPPKLVKTKIADGISVMLPSNLLAMNPEDLALRYPSVRAPLGAYTNEDRVVDFSVNVSATQWPDGDVELAQKFFRASLFNLYNKVEMISEGTAVIHKKKFIFFEFDSRLNPDRQQLSSQDAVLRYTYIMYLVEKKRSLVFSFNCTKDLKEDWQETARAIMKSVKVK